MPVAAPLAIAGATIGSAVIGAKASKKAAKAQTQAADAGIAEQRRQYDLTREDMAPWRNAGGAAVGQAFDMLQPGYDYTASPGYQFRFNEGQRALQGSAAARQNMLSTGTLKDLIGYGEGLAASDFGDSFNRRSTLAGLGNSSVTALGGFGQQSANNIGNLLGQAGQAKASGYMNTAGAINNGIGNLLTLGLNGGFNGLVGNSPYGGGYNPYGTGGPLY